MAHDVNQSETDVAAQMRSALVEKISTERIDLWIPEDTEWEWLGGALRLRFNSDFTCQLAKKMLLADLSRSLRAVTQQETVVLFETRPMDRGLNRACTTADERNPTQPIQEKIRTVLHDSPPKRSSRLLLADCTLAGEKPQREAIDSKPSSSGDRSTEAKEKTAKTTAAEQPSRIAGLRNVWDSFLSGGSNRLAWTTANMVVEEPGRLSPVLIHGPSGCGKSMLITGIVQKLRTQRRLLRVVHMTSEQFTNDFTEGLRGGGLPMFRRKYRDVEALLLDDIQFFAGKKSTIAELKHTLDNLVRLGKQVVLTADRSLNDLHFLGNELVGRLRGGLVTPLFPIDEELRLALLTRRIEQARLKVSQEIVEQLAARICGDGRVISGIVNRLIAVSATSRVAMDWETCWSAVYDLVQATQPVVRLGDIERAVCSMFGLDAQSLQTSSKHRSVTQPRMLAMFLARKYTPAAYHEIGQYFGRRKHSTVISAEKTVNSWLSDNPSHQLARGLSVRDAIRQVEAQLHVG